MREILFRGKSVYTEKWAVSVCPHGVMKSGHLCDDFILETVGQFTGLTDKDGKKIFDGDVVKAVIVRDLGGGTENREETGVIGYDKIGMIGLIAKYDGVIPVWSDFFQELTLSGFIDDFWFEVIGNIHDNPELLEKPIIPS
jgi:uncharacterized phage protein (TIGR01671 family)